MPIIEEIHNGDIGTIFELTVYDGSTVVDLSSALELKIIFGKPSGATLTKDASLVTDGTDGKIEYTTVNGDIDEDGYWTLQVYIRLATGNWRSNIIDFKVYENL
jgi:hypothetical protein